jgi:hypothetical protein
MLNRLLMAVHWFLFIWFLGFPTVIVVEFFDKVSSQLGSFVYTGLILFLNYVIVLWLFKRRWIWFPWQHVKPKESKNE